MGQNCRFLGQNPFAPCMSADAVPHEVIGIHTEVTRLNWFACVRFGAWLEDVQVLSRHKLSGCCVCKACLLGSCVCMVGGV